MKNYRQIAQETLDIIKANEYVFSDKKVAISENPQSLQEVVIYTPEKVAEALIELEKNVRQNSGEIKVDILDTLTSARVNGYGKTLALNFANAYRPGGGFLYGAIAQEEAICRSSTLYASIASEKAKVMYEYNRAHVTPEGSDFMLLSPNVSVFRNRDCDLLSEPFEVSVITVAAPNLYDEAYELEEPKSGEIMRHKIKNIIAVAAQNSYDTLILGAWGCGAFGHDARNMAEYFYDVLVNQNYKRLFEKIVFSIFSSDEYDYNYAQFAKRFN